MPTFTQEERKSAFRFIVALGFVSLFADMTYEGAHSVIGPLLKDLGASATEVGIIAGLGEMIAASLRYFSGKLADRTRAYWTITTLGYFLNLVVVPGLANRLLVPFASQITVALPDTVAAFPAGRTALRGNPVRRRVLEGDAATGFALLGLDPSLPLL